MRTDPNVGAEIRRSETFEQSAREGAALLRGDDWLRTSLSGNEPNRFFWSLEGAQFHDLSPLSGADHPGDGRGFAWLDFDGDGWLDIAAVHVNRPRLMLFRNRLGERPGAEPEAAGRTGAAPPVPPDRNWIRVRLAGGQRVAEPSFEWSNRDGIGAVAEARLADGSRLVREAHAGEGFAAQNSAVLHFGIGAADAVESLEVRWPSGRVSRLGPIAAGSRVEVDERDAAAPRNDGR